jgi:hypothetical protein
MQLTQNHYIDPTRVAHIEIHPAGQRSPDPLFWVTFASEHIPSIELSGQEAEEAATNWRRFHDSMSDSTRTAVAESESPSDSAMTVFSKAAEIIIA